VNFDLGDSGTTIAALVGTLFAGAGLEIIRKVLAKSKEREDSATAMRKELKDDIVAIKAEMEKAVKEIDQWRQRYYRVYEAYIMTKMMYERAKNELQDHGIEPPEPSSAPVVDTPTPDEIQ
jgi:phosphoglycolate phosphatase-like HAD superfamily hydrolase